LNYVNLTSAPRSYLPPLKRMRTSVNPSASRMAQVRCATSNAASTDSSTPPRIQYHATWPACRQWVAIVHVGPVLLYLHNRDRLRHDRPLRG
jgi:hypothetical protein